MNFDITHDGRTTLNTDRKSALALGYPEEAIAAAEEAAAVRNGKTALRKEIERSAGDLPSLLGTAADGAQLAIHALAELSGKLATANSLAEVRDAAAPFAALTEGLRTKVENGEVKMTFLVKGVEPVLAEIARRSTTVSDALLAASDAPAPDPAPDNAG